MPCYHPLTRVCSPGCINLETGKLIGNVTKYVPLDQRSPDNIYQDIPCGQCLGCRIDYSRKWADRLMMEAKHHDHTWFVTLTYDDAHLPFGGRSDPETGEFIELVPTLRKRDCQLFMKSLRKAVAPQKIRFYCAGEYGEETFRPHMHLIIFGLDLDDLKFYKLNKLSQPYYTSETLSNAWSNKGYVVVTPATYETMAYTARYVTKKLKGFDGIFYKQAGIEPPFSLMSRKPGIAADSFSAELMEYDNIMLPQGRKAPHPRYFQKLLERDYPDFYEEYKAEREKRNDRRMQQLLDSIEMPYLDYLKLQEENFKNRIKSLDDAKTL